MTVVRPSDPSSFWRIRSLVLLLRSFSTRVGYLLDCGLFLAGKMSGPIAK